MVGATRRPTIGFIGLGHMGQAFTRRLVAQGYEVRGLDVRAEQVRLAGGHGVIAAATPAALAAACDVILVCVTATKNLVEVIEGADGVLSATPRPGLIVVDHSTSEIAATERLARRLAGERGISFMDAPVSGGPAAAESGTLAIMAGGAAETIARLAPVMAQLGTLTHMGGIGAGQATKLVNQAIVLTNYCVLAEALRLAEAHGVDAARIPQALKGGHAGSNLLPILFERMIERDFAPRGYARQVLKDLEMLNDAAHAKGLALPMAGQALTLFRHLNAQGKSEFDGSAVLTWWPEPTVTK